MAKTSKRKDGRWQVIIYHQGKRKFFYGATKKEVEQKATDYKISIRQGLDISLNKLTFKDWADSWLKIKKSQVSTNTYDKLKYPLNHLLDRFGDVPLEKIKNLDIQELIQDLSQFNPSTGKPAAINTMKKVLDTATQIFNLAVQNQAITFNPTNGVLVPTFTLPEKRRALTPEEQQWIIDTPHRAQTSAMIMMLAGLRRGELLALTWSDIDLKEKTISITKSVNFVGNKAVIKNSAKTDDSIRKVIIPDILVDHLKEQPKESIYLSCNTSQGIHTQVSWRRMWDSYMHELNLKYGDFVGFKPERKNQSKPMVITPFTPHWLRHTFATNMHLAHIDNTVAAIQMGHSTNKTMLDIYTHLTDDFIRTEMDKLNVFLSPTTVKAQSI